MFFVFGARYNHSIHSEFNSVNNILVDCVHAIIILVLWTSMVVEMNRNKMYCCKLMENLRTEISISMLFIFNTFDVILSVRENDLLLIY